MFEAPLVKTYLNRSYEHALNTTMLSVMLGRAFNYTPDELTALGTAAMLHDIGKLIFPDLANKPLRDLSPAEARRLRVHPAAGALIVARSAPLSNLEQAAIRQHHEQQDGRGYPMRLIGTNEPPLRVRVQGNREIFRFAEILAVANTFDNLINGDLVVEAMTPGAGDGNAGARRGLALQPRRGVEGAGNHQRLSRGRDRRNHGGQMLFSEGMRGVVRRSHRQGA